MLADRIPELGSTPDKGLSTPTPAERGSERISKEWVGMGIGMWVGVLSSLDYNLLSKMSMEHVLRISVEELYREISIPPLYLSGTEFLSVTTLMAMATGFVIGAILERRSKVSN